MVYRFLIAALCLGALLSTSSVRADEKAQGHPAAGGAAATQKPADAHAPADAKHAADPHAKDAHAAGAHGDTAHGDAAHGDSSHGHDAHGKGGGNIFAGGIGNVVWTALLFGLVVTVLGKSAWPQLLAVLQEREHTIRVALENAKKERIEAEKLLAQYTAQMDRAREQATAIVDEGRRSAADERRRIQDEARKQSDELIAAAKREIEAAAAAANAELAEHASATAASLAGQLIRKDVRPDGYRDLVAQVSAGKR